MKVRVTLVSLVAIAATVLVAAPASATLTSQVQGGVLTVTGDADPEVLILSCSGGDVEVNSADPGSGPAACADLTGIEVRTGDGNDRILLPDVTPSEFPSLTSILVDAGGDYDYVLGSPGDDDLRGGIDDDTILPGGGHDAVDGGDGSDELEVNGTKGLTLTNGRLVDGDAVATLDSIEEVHISTAARSVVIDASRFRGRTLVVTGDGADRILLGRGNDIANAGGGPDRIFGGGGIDSLGGDDGKDVIRGQAGNDDLQGGDGRDRCIGGPGGDRFVSCEYIDHVP